VAINWDDNSKRKIFKEALQSAYPIEADFRIFVDEELNENPAVVAGGDNLEHATHALIQWARSVYKLNEVFEAFCRENPVHPSILQLQQQVLVKKSNRLNPEDMGTLFGQFSYQNFAYILKAFLEAFKSVKGDFWTYRPDNPPLNELVQIQDLLEVYDNPTLFVRFIEKAIIELQKSNTDKDYATLRTLCDRIAQKYQVPPETPKLDRLTTKQGYLLVALKDSGRVTQGNPSVIVFADLHVVGEANPIEFESSPVTCSLNEVANHLSKLIAKAEEALISYNCGKVTVEVFLPSIHIEENVADWIVQNEQGSPRPFGKYRGFIVRSFERILNRTTQTVLKQNWQILKNCEATSEVGQGFHSQKNCPSPGDLEVLRDIPGLKLAAELPSDFRERQDIFYDIINSAVPIALWLCDTNNSTIDERLITFDSLIQESCITDFADLAQKWRTKRIHSDSTVIQHLRLLCDCPDRWPSLPDTRRDEDLLVAS
jgi:hypothetical protein